MNDEDKNKDKNKYNANRLNTIVYVRLGYIVGDNGVLPIARSTFYAGIKAGIFPAPRRLGPRISVWPKSEIDELCRRLSGE